MSSDEHSIYWKDKEREIAGMLFCTAEKVKELIKAAEEAEEDASFLQSTWQWLVDRSNVFAPPGEPEAGYPNRVVSLESYKVRTLPPDRPRTRGC